MSENVLSYGLMAPLLNKIEYEDHEEKASNQGLDLNYEGTVLFMDISGKDDVFGGMFFIDPDRSKEFEELAEKIGLPIDFTKIRMFVSPWYNGSDSYMSDYELPTE